MNPDPIMIARRLLDRAEKELIERIIAAGSSAVAEGAGAVRGYFLSELQEFMTALGKLPHATANWILDLDRGWQARRLTRVEIQLVLEAYGDRINPADVRIVKGEACRLGRRSPSARAIPQSPWATPSTSRRTWEI